jgi:hypothetical protein
MTKFFNDQINPVSKLDLLPVEYHRQPDLAGHFKAALLEFMGETALVSAFEQSRTKNGVNVHCRRNDCARNVIDPQRRKRGRGNSHPQSITQKPRSTL